MKSKIISLMLLLLTAMIWGFAFVAQADGVNYVGPLTLNGVRFAVGVVSLLPVVFIFERKKLEKDTKTRLIKYTALAGCVLFCASTLQQFGIAYTGSAGVAGLITGLYTVMIPIACFLFFKQKTGITTWIGAICAVFGLFLLCFKPGEGLSFGFGELLLLIGSFFWTAHVIVIDRVAKDLPSLHFAWGQFLVCAILGIASMFIFEEPRIAGILEAKWSILYCGVLSVGVAYTLQIIAQKRADPTYAAIVLSTESVFSLVGGVAFGIDKMTVLGIFGCLLMFGGIVLSQLDLTGKKERNAQKTK